MIKDSHPFLEQIQDLIHANGWEGQLTTELISGNKVHSQNEIVKETVRIRLGAGHSTAPLDIVNDYQEGQSPLEQVQQECLRALRTGRPGI